MTLFSLFRHRPFASAAAYAHFASSSFAAQDGQTALHCAALNERLDILEAPMAEGCDPEAKNKARRPPPNAAPRGRRSIQCLALKSHR